MIPALMDLPLFALAALSFYCLGRLVLGRFLEDWPTEASWALYSAAGMGLFAYLAYVLGLAGLLQGPFLWGALCVPLAAGIALRWRPSLPAKGLSWSAWAVLAVSLFLYVGAHSPLIGHDALCYHLYLAKAFAKTGAVFSIPFHENSDWPLLWEMLFAAAYRLAGAGLAKSFHVYAAVLTALLVCGSARRFVGAKKPALAALLVLLSPLVANVAVTAYIDAGLALFSACALFLFLEWRERSRTSALVLAGIFLGLAMGTKFLAVFTAAILGLTLVLGALLARDRHRERWTAVLLFTAAALLAGGYWYGKLWVLYGNPVHPYFGHWFGKGADILAHYETPIPKNLLGYLSAPFWITFLPAKLSGLAEQPGPLFLLFAPAALGARRSFRAVGFLVFYACLYLLLWVTLYQNLRFLIPLVPALAVLAAAGYDWMRERGPFTRKCAAALFVLCLAAQAGALGYHFRREYKVLAGLETQEAYLARTERVHEIAAYLNKKYGTEARLFVPNEVHLYYFDAPVVRGNYLMAANPDEFKAGELARGLGFLKELGFTHVVLFLEPSFEGRPFLAELARATPEELAASGTALETRTVSAQGEHHLLYRLT